MKFIEKFRAYVAEPVLASLFLSILGQTFSFRSLADFTHSEARDALALFLVLLGAAFALWIGLFWVSNTDFGAWLAERGELEAINDTYIYTVVAFLAAGLACLPSAFLSVDHVEFHGMVLWLQLFALCCVPSMLTNTRSLLRLHSVFNQRSQKIKTFPARAENGH